MGWTKFHQDKAADQLEELCRRATQKTLERPDFEANAEVVQFINSRRMESQEVLGVFTRRLEQKTAQKVWLAMVLIKQVLAECSTSAAYKADLVSAVSRVAAQPMDRYSPTLPAQQRLKSAGYDIMQVQDAAAHPEQGPDTLGGRKPSGKLSPRKSAPKEVPAQQAPKSSPRKPISPKKAPMSPKKAAGLGIDSQPSVELSPIGGAKPRVKFSDELGGSAGAGSGEAAWPPLSKRLRSEVERAKLYIGFLQEVVLGYSSRGSSTGPQGTGPAESALLDHSITKLRTFRAHFRSTVAEASMYHNSEAQSLLAEALAVTETLNNSMDLYENVVSAQADKGSKAVGASSQTRSAGEGSVAPAPASHLLD